MALILGYIGGLSGHYSRLDSRNLEPITRVTRQAWVKELKTRHGKGLDAPRWLWSGVLDLAALHEGAYLEHCGRYALGERLGA